MPKCTFRSVRDAAEAAGCLTGSTEKEKIAGDIPKLPDDCADITITVPTTLGGTIPYANRMPEGRMVVYDCAHTCHPVMFEGISFEPGHFAVLSFYPTKPAGAFGGGARAGLLQEGG